MTKEHVLADWLSAYLPEAKASKKVHSRDGSTPNLTTHSMRRGPDSAFGHKVRVVCKPCNEGWMSDLERATQPILIPMMEGNSVRLTWGRCKTLATWAFKTATMIDCLDSDVNRGVSPDHIETLYRDRKPPATCQIWVVPTTGGEDSGYAGKYSTAAGKKKTLAEVVPRSTYASAFMLGHVGFVVFGTGRPDALAPVAPVLGPDMGLTALWPRKPGDRLNWPPAGGRRDIDWLKATIYSLQRYIRASRGQT